jgi:hypothetical protein
MCVEIISDTTEYAQYLTRKSNGKFIHTFVMTRTTRTSLYKFNFKQADVIHYLYRDVAF